MCSTVRFLCVLSVVRGMISLSSCSPVRDSELKIYTSVNTYRTPRHTSVRDVTLACIDGQYVTVLTPVKRGGGCTVTAARAHVNPGDPLRARATLLLGSGGAASCTSCTMYISQLVADRPTDRQADRDMSPHRWSLGTVCEREAGGGSGAAGPVVSGFLGTSGGIRSPTRSEWASCSRATVHLIPPFSGPRTAAAGCSCGTGLCNICDHPQARLSVRYQSSEHSSSQPRLQLLNSSRRERMRPMGPRVISDQYRHTACQIRPLGSPVQPDRSIDRSID